MKPPDFTAISYDGRLVSLTYGQPTVGYQFARVVAHRQPENNKEQAWYRTLVTRCGPGVRIEPEMRDDLGLHPKAVFLLAVIVHRYERHESITYGALVDVTGWARSTVHRYLVQLEGAGFVRRDRGKQGTLQSTVGLVATDFQATSL